MACKCIMALSPIQKLESPSKVSRRPTELEVEADGGKRHIRAVAFVSAPEMHIAEGLPPPDRWAHLIKLHKTGMQSRLA